MMTCSTSLSVPKTFINLKAMRLMIYACCLLAANGSMAAKEALAVIGYEVNPISQTASLTALGRLQAKQSVDIAANVTERVKVLHFNEGQVVKRGQILITLEDQEERASLQEAKALAAEAQRQYQRVKDIENKGSITQSMIDEKYRQWQTAQAQIQVIEARLADRQIVAPFDGQLGLSLYSLGAMVSPGAKMVSLDDTSEMYLDLYVATRYLPQLKIDLALNLQVAAYPQHTFHGKILAISPRLEADLRLVKVRALIPNPLGLLKTNMSVKAQIQLTPQSQLRVPNTAFMMLGDQTFVYRLIADQDKGYKAQKTLVTLGDMGSKTSEVLTGLKAQDLVVSQGVLRLKPNGLVSLKALENDQTQADLLKPLAKPKSADASKPSQNKQD